MRQIEAAKLQAYLQRWRARNPYRWQQGGQVVANDFLLDTAFTDIKLAGLLESPGGVTFTQVVQSVLPFPANVEAAVLTEAIEIAAKKQTSGQVVGGLAIGVLVAIIVWGLFGDS